MVCAVRQVNFYANDWETNQRSFNTLFSETFFNSWDEFLRNTTTDNFIFKFESQSNVKLKGEYDYIFDFNNVTLRNGTVTFNDSIYTLNLRLPNGKKYTEKVKYGNSILLDNFTNNNLIISIRKDEIQKDTIRFTVHNRKANYMNYLDVAENSGKLIKVK